MLPRLGWLLLVLTVCMALGLAGILFLEGRSRQTDWRRRLVRPGLNEREFTQICIEALRERMPDVKATVVGELAVDAQKDGDWERRVYLGNLWRVCCRETDARVQFVEHFVNSIPMQEDISSDDMAVDLDALVPIIKDRLFLEQFSHVADGAKPYFGEIIAGDIWVMYGLDQECGISFITEETGKALAMSADELREKARQNLRRLLPTIKVAGGGPVYLMVADGTYEASFLLFDGMWEQQAERVQGDIVAAVPARDTLMFTGSESAEGLCKLQNAVEQIYEEAPYAISKTLLVRRGGKWEVFGDGR